MDFLPINPQLTASGTFAALAPDLGEAAKPVPLVDPAKAFTNFSVISDALSLDVAGRLGLGSIFSGAAGTQERGFFFDAMTYTDEYREHGGGGTGVTATRWGVGIRVVLRVTDLAANASLNFGLVGAAVELQQARARYEIQGIGIGAEGLVIVLDELDAIGDFRYETYQRLNGTVVKKLTRHIKAHQDALTPQPVAVVLTPPLDPIGNARSVYVAMKGIADRRSLGETLVRAPAVLSRETIRKVYAQVASLDDPGTQPSKEAEREAERWLEA